MNFAAQGFATGQLNDRWFAYLGSLSKTGSLNDRITQWLGGSGTIEDRWYSFLATAGYTSGSLDDRMYFTTGTQTAAPTWQTVGTVAASAAGSSVVIPKPTGLAASNLMVAFIGTMAAATLPVVLPPTGWRVQRIQEVAEAALANFRGTLLYKIADATDAAATNVTFGLTSSADRFTGEIHRISGADLSIPINADGGGTLTVAAATPDPVVPSVTTTIAKCLVMYFVSHNHAATTRSHTPPASNTETTDFESTVTAVLLGSTSGYRAFTATGATGTATVDCSETTGTNATFIRVAIAPS